MIKKSHFHTIEIENVFFLYAVGQTYIAIYTKPSGQWSELPEYMRLSFAIETPPDIAPGEIKDVVRKAIRAKLAERKRAGKRAGVNHVQNS